VLYGLIPKKNVSEFVRKQDLLRRFSCESVTNSDEQCGVLDVSIFFFLMRFFVGVILSLSTRCGHGWACFFLVYGWKNRCVDR
jgi:hypothetical protein